MAKVSFVGIGTMGGPMARNAIKGGHAVTVYDLAADAMKRFHNTGARLADSPADAAKDADFVLTVLPNSPHVREAVYGPKGIAETLSPKTLFVECTTGSVQDFKVLAKSMGERGLRIIDAALGRSPYDAEAGTLLFLVGGTKEQVEEARPVLATMSESIVHCGPQGAGITTKVINNYMTVVGVVMAAEALTLGRKAGLDRAMLVKVIQSTVAGRGAINVVYPKKALAGDLTPMFAGELARKDMTLALELGAQLGVPLFTGSGARQAYALQAAQGKMHLDMTALLSVLEEVTGANKI